MFRFEMLDIFKKASLIFFIFLCYFIPINVNAAPEEVELSETIGISDSISIHLIKTLTETLFISDSVHAEKKRIVTCTNFSLDDVFKPNDPHCMLWPGYGSKDAKVFFQIANCPLTLITTVCKADNFVVVEAQLAGEGQCFFDDGIDVIVWSTVFNDSVFTIILPEPDPVPDPEPQPVSQSNGKSGGGGRINLDVSSYTSLDRLAIWLADENYFKIAVRDLISQDLVDLEPSQVKNPPDWFYITVEFWDTEQISDEEFFAALEFILK